MNSTQTKAGMLPLVLIAAAFATGCQTYHKKTEEITQHWRQGNVTEATRLLTVRAEKAEDSKDTVIWRLEQAAALRAAGQYQESIDAFNIAEEKIDRHEEAAKTSITGEAGAMFSNQANLTYEGRDYDKVMLNAYKGLNYLQLGDLEKARTEFIRAYQRQQDAVENNKKRIEKELEEARKLAEAKAAEEAAAESGEEVEEPESEEEKEARAQKMAAKAKEDPKFNEQVESNYAELNDLQPYADYVNPFVVYLDGLYFMNASTGASDWERARKSFERALGLAGENKFVRQDLESMDKLLAGESPSPTVYVIFETGAAPVRDQIRIDVPLFFIGSGNVPYAGAAFPILKKQDDYLPTLAVSAGAATESTALLASMDTVVAQSFKNELPTIITKTLISAAMKAAAAYAINEAASQQSSIAGLLSKVVTAGTQAAMNIADTRTWTTLPKEIQVCRLPRSADGKLVLSGPAGFPTTEVTLDEGMVNLVYVKSTSTASPLMVSQMKLK